jgi:hypothetical protein
MPHDNTLSAAEDACFRAEKHFYVPCAKMSIPNPPLLREKDFFALLQTFPSDSGKALFLPCLTVRFRHPTLTNHSHSARELTRKERFSLLQ